ncbi:MAG: hypothetical protein WHF31_15340 [Candidatus Dehalobacter alkaniphilus]
MKNKLIDLNNHLFEQLERLNDDDLQGDDLETELKRAKAISQVANNIINNASVMLEAQKHKDEYYGSNKNGDDVPEILKLGNEK